MQLFKRSDHGDHVVSVQAGAEVCQVVLRRRPGARRLTLRVSQVTGEATLTMPQRGDLQAALRFLEAHGEWIVTRMKRVPRRIPFTPGSIAPVRGTPHLLVWAEGERSAPAFVHHPDEGAMIVAGGDRRHFPRRVQELLKRTAATELEAAVMRYAERLGVRPRSITLRDQRTRWGSCTYAGRLNFSWRLIMAPPYVLDYLAAHEVCHLREMNHSQRFWALVHGLCPHTDAAEAWLKSHGAGLHRYGPAAGATAQAAAEDDAAEDDAASARTGRRTTPAGPVGAQAPGQTPADPPRRHDGLRWF